MSWLKKGTKLQIFAGLILLVILYWILKSPNRDIIQKRKVISILFIRIGIFNIVEHYLMIWFHRGEDIIKNNKKNDRMGWLALHFSRNIVI